MLELKYIFETLVVGFLGVFTWLVKYYFSTIHKDLAALKSGIHDFQGRFQLISDSMHRATTELAVTRQEVKALWRTVDGFPRRVADGYTNSDGES